VPAAAVTPASRAYINVVAVKKLVVGFRARGCLVPSTRSACWAVVWIKRQAFDHDSRYAGTRVLCGSPIHLGWKQLRNHHIAYEASGDVTVSKTDCSKEPTSARSE